METSDVTTETPLSVILGLPEKATLNGKEYKCLPLDFNDIAEMEKHIGRVEFFDFTCSTHQRLAVWLALRKIDPTLTEEQKRDCEYNMTIEDAGRLLSIGADELSERGKFVMDVMFMSGLAIPVKPGEEDAAKKPGPLNRAQRRAKK